MFRKLALGIMLASLLAFLVMMPMQVQEQDTDEFPLLPLLTLIPDTADIRLATIYYTDYRALERSRQIEKPTSADFAEETHQSKLWSASVSRFIAGLPIIYSLPNPDSMRDVLGFGYLDIDQTVRVPSLGLNVLAGNFDQERVDEAFAARGLIEQDFNGFSVWCGNVQCDNSGEWPVADTASSNPFYGNPFAIVSDSRVVSIRSNYTDILNQVFTSYSGETRSLAEAADYQALAEVFAVSGNVLQAQFEQGVDRDLWRPPFLPGMYGFPSNPSAENIAAHSEKLMLDRFGTLPGYSVFALADINTGDEQLVMIALVYHHPSIAEAAARELKTRLENYYFLTSPQGRPFSAVLAQYDATIDEPYVYESEATNKAVAIITLSYPLADNERRSMPPFYEPTGSLYYLMSEHVESGPAYFLWDGE